MPWHFSADLKRFKQLTLGNTVIMGRKTFESLGKPLPGRENFVLTHSKRANEAPLKFFSSIDEALKNVSTEKAFIIGGEKVFQQTIDKVEGIWLTRIDEDYEGDVFYPEIPRLFEIKTREKSPEEPKLEFLYYEKKK